MKKYIQHIQHILNPLQVYCRLLDCGLPRHCAMGITRWYGKTIYRIIRKIIKGNR